MHRNLLVDQLKKYRNAYRDETEMVERYLGFVEANEDCFERSLQMGHVTASAWVVNREGSHVLLTHHKKLSTIIMIFDMHWALSKLDSLMRISVGPWGRSKEMESMAKPLLFWLV